MVRRTPLKRKTPLAAKGKSDTAQIKDDIQALLRAIVIKRDGGCLLRNSYDAPSCNGFDKSGKLIHQADHLVTRANSATYADPRLVACVCKGHHGWKKWHQKEYEAVVRELLPADRVKLWDDCERDSWKAHRKYTSDWVKEAAYLRSLL
jgi:hypothetical protein